MVSTSNKSTKKRMPKHPHTRNLPLWGSSNINRFVKLTVRRMFSLLHYSGILAQELPLVKREFPIFFALFGTILLQIDQQHRNIRRADTGDSSRLADGHGADFPQLLPGLQPQSRDGIIINIHRQ